MDILDIFLDILLKPPQPFMGLFFEYFFHIRGMKIKKTSEIQNFPKEGTTFTPFLDGLSLQIVSMAHGNVSLVLQDISHWYF